MRTVFWEDNALKLIDQRRLPGSLEIIACRSHVEVAQAIRNMTVRGAPAIGAAAAFGLVFAAQESAGKTTSQVLSDLESAAAVLKAFPPNGS